MSTIFARGLPAWCAGLFVALLGSASRADIIWDEMSKGDLSDDRFVPTPLVLTEGSNVLIGILQGGNDEGFDRDYYSITVPEGYALSQINLLFYLSKDFAAFLGIQPGAIFPDDPETVMPGDLLGWVHFGPGDAGNDLLPIMGSHGQGFSPPLPSGTYTFWAQQFDGYTDYALEFVVETPGPSSAALLGCLLWVQRRRRPRLIMPRG